MKKVFYALISALFFSSGAYGAEGVNPPPKASVKNYAVLETGLVYSYSNPNPLGDVTKDTYFHFAANLRYGFLDLYGYLDYSNIFKTPKLSDKFYTSPNYIKGEINPRISLNSFLGVDMSFLIFKEWFLSYDFEFDNGKGRKGMLKHYLGGGASFDLPFLSYLNMNIYARYIEQNYGRNEYSWDGWMFHMSYEVPIYKFSFGLEIAYTSWLKWVFSARTGGIPNATTDSVQWNNMFKISFEGVAVGYVYQVNYRYGEMKSHSSEADMQSIGIYYSYKF